jgi:hypothetical protein
MDTTISGELARLRIQEMVQAAECTRRVLRPKNTRRPRPKGEGGA